MTSSNTSFTEDEILATIRVTSDPLLLVEGNTDRTLIRTLEKKIGCFGLILPCGCRNTLLRVFERRNEFPGKSVYFLADKDMYVFNGVPQKYADVCFTSGYSIENDILEIPWVQDLMSATELQQYSTDLELIQKWFWNEISTNPHAPGVDKSTYHVLNTYCTSQLPSISNCCQYGSKILQNPSKYLRGKNLLQLAKNCLSGNGRYSKYSESNLLEMGVTFNLTPSILDLIEKLKSLIPQEHLSDVPC